MDELHELKKKNRDERSLFSQHQQPRIPAVVKENIFGAQGWMIGAIVKFRAVN